MAPTLVIADYPIGYSSGFGETLYNLFTGFPDEDLWSAHPGHLSPAADKKRGQSIKLPSPSRPHWLPQQISLAYYPFLKAQQFQAAAQAVRHLSDVVQRHSIRNLLVVPVTPWILSAAFTLHKQHPKLNLVVYVMDDWQGHHESHQLLYSRRRQRLLREVIARANVRIAVSREMAAHYEDSFGKNWLVAHNGVHKNFLPHETNGTKPLNQIFLAGDVNVFRFDAVLAFAEAIERHNHRHQQSITFTVMGEVAQQHRSALSALSAVNLLKRQSHSECLNAMNAADVLYLPLAFSQRSSRISLYSMPTKLPEYLASGKKVLFHAPRESAAFRVAERHDLKPRLATIDPRALDAFVENLIVTDQSHDESRKVQKAIVEEFDIDRLSQNFQSAFV